MLAFNNKAMFLVERECGVVVGIQLQFDPLDIGWVDSASAVGLEWIRSCNVLAQWSYHSVPLQ